MKLIQFYRDGTPVLGLETENGVLDVEEEGRRLGVDAPGTMLELVSRGEAGLAELRRMEQSGGTPITGFSYAPAVTGMEKILCVGLNYRSHIRESGEKEPEFPVLFSKFSNALAACGDVVYLDPAYEEYDYEAELVIVIGKRVKNATAEEAKAAIFGYTCGNDLSNRTTQLHRGGQWLVGKTMDGFGPIGPRVVTADAIDPSDLRIRSRVNGETRQDARTGMMIFSCGAIVSYISRHMTLMPGDIVFTGTPAGVMLGYAADRKQWLRSGDVVEVELEGIGVLTNRMV